MAPIEFHRYTDGRGDTIIYKFDSDVARKPDPKWPNDSAITVYQHYVIARRTGTVNYHSDLLPLELAIDRSRNDKLALQPAIGKVIRIEEIITEDGLKVKMQYVWKGWGHGEGYRRGWAKLCVESSEPIGLPAKPSLTWRY